MTQRIEQDGAAPATANRELSLLKSILYPAEADEIIPSNPSRGRRVKKQPKNNQRERTIIDLELTDEKIALLFGATEDYLKPILKLAVTTGMRRDEILETKWKAFNATLRTFRIPAENAKSKKERVVPIDPVPAVELDALPRRGEYFFINPDTGKRRRDVWDGFAAACRSVGIETGRKAGWVFHDLRHVAASCVVKATDVVTAARILSHSSLDMTMRYVHPTDTDKHEAVRKVAERLFQGRQKYVNTFEQLAERGNGQQLYY